MHQELVKTHLSDSSVYDQSHYALVIGKTTINNTPTYKINDPYYGQGTLASMADNKYYYGIQNFVSYQPKLNIKLKNRLPYLPYLLLTGHSPIHLIITDPLGRRLGYDPRDNQTWNEIPDGSYFVDTISSADGESLPDQKILNVPNPITGEYMLTIIGYGFGPYEIDIAKASGYGLPIRTFISGTAEPSTEYQYIISFYPGMLLFLPLILRN